MSRLSPCEKCDRHIRKTEASCPFCGAASSSPRESPHHLGAAAVAVAIALGGAACSTTTPATGDTPATTPTTPTASVPTTATPPATASVPTPPATATATASASATASATATTKPTATTPATAVTPPPDRPRMKYGMPPKAPGNSFLRKRWPVRLVYSENLLTVSLPPGHRFPMRKYRMIYEGLAADHAGLFQQAGRASIEDLGLIHEPGYVHAMETGTISPQALRRLGFPWSPAIAERARRSVGGTLAALGWAFAHGAAGHIAGGTHHGFADRGEGYCVFNDLAVAIAVARRDHGIERVAVIDLDVHQGNGTAALFQGDAGVFTLSLHGAKNYPFQKEPSSLDVPLPDGCEDAAYLAALAPALEAVAAHRPELLLYQAGVDPLAGDKLGRLALSHEGLARRDAEVYALARRLGVPLLVTLGGGYHPIIEESVAAHIAVYQGLVRELGDR